MPEDESLQHRPSSGPTSTSTPATLPGAPPPAATSATSHQPSDQAISSGSPPTHHSHQHPAFVAPSSYLRPRAASRPAQPAQDPPPPQPMSTLDREQLQALATIRDFLKLRTGSDVLPLSFRLIILDTELRIKQSLDILVQNGIVSAPLWDSRTSTFAGLLTTLDYINVIQYYWQNPGALENVNQFRLDSLRDIEKAIGVTPIETVSIHPLKPLYEICQKMVQSRARRMPIVDEDDETRRNMVVSVITQYRILKFIAVNVQELQMLQKPLRDIEIGTRTNLQTASLDTPVIDVIHMLVDRSISSVPILDPTGVVVNVFEAVDVITLIKGGNYDELNLSVGEALLKRADDFPGIFTCTMHDRLDGIFDTLRRSRVHRFIMVDESTHLKGVLTLSDILEYLLIGESEAAVAAAVAANNAAS